MAIPVPPNVEIITNHMDEQLAKILFPVPTEHPDAYNKVTKNLTIIEEGKKYTVNG